MLGAIIGILLSLVVFGVILWAVEEILRHVPMPEFLRSIVHVVIVVLIVLVGVWVVIELLGVAGVHVPTLFH